MNSVQKIITLALPAGPADLYIGDYNESNLDILLLIQCFGGMPGVCAKTFPDNLSFQGCRSAQMR